MKSKILGLLAVALLAAPMAAHAALITYDFTVNGGSSGPLAGVEASGMFSYDDSIVVPGGAVAQAGLLTTLSFTWNGIAYDQTTANTGGLIFDVAGNLSSPLFGSNCSDGGCGVAPATESWLIANALFVYSVPTSTEDFRGSVSLTLREASVPEPTTLALLGFGLVGMGYSRRRKAS